MTKAFVPVTLVPGATRAFEAGPMGLTDYMNPKFDKKGRPVWNMPKPVKYVLHFKSAGMRRKFEEVKTKIDAQVEVGEMKAKDAEKMLSSALHAACNQVPIYRGVSASLARSIRAEFRRRERQKSLSAKIKKFLGDDVAGFVGAGP